MIKAQIRRITIKADSISVELAGDEAAADNPSSPPRQIVSLPWTKTPFRATKGAINGPAIAPDSPLNEQVVLAAIGRAKRWGSVRSWPVAASRTSPQREGKGEHQVRLRFTIGKNAA
jgi:hypothetical protein